MLNAGRGGPTLDDPSGNNVNWVHGPGEDPQEILPPLVYLGLLMVGLPLAVFLPTHLVLKRLFRLPRSI